MNKNLSDIQSDIIKGCTWNHSLWHSSMCNTSHCGFVVPQKRSFTKKVFYFTPNVSCRWIKLEFINCIKTKIWCVTWISYLQLVCKCKLFFIFFLVLFSAPGQQVLFIFLHWFSERVKTEKQVCMDFCSLSTQVSFVTNKLKWNNCYCCRFVYQYLTNNMV